MSDVKRSREDVKVEAETTLKRVRPGQRKYNQNSGRLQTVMDMKVPGYRLYLAVDGLRNDPMRIQNLMKPEVGYSWVHPSEVDFRDTDGNLYSGDKVVIDMGNGQKGYLLKQPQEWADEDTAAKIKLNKQQIFLENTEAVGGKFNGLLNTSNTTRVS